MLHRSDLQYSIYNEAEYPILLAIPLGITLLGKMVLKNTKVDTNRKLAFKRRKVLPS